MKFMVTVFVKVIHKELEYVSEWHDVGPFEVITVAA